MDRIIFVTNTHSRKQAFQLQTIARKRDGGIAFEKKALSEAALPRIELMVKTYAEIKSNGLGEHFAKILKHSSTAVEFETLKGLNFESILVDTILADDKKKVVKLLDLYRKFLEHIKAGEAHTHNHTYDKRLFGPNLFTAYKDSPCIQPGILDINFDNVMIDGEKLKGFDYEWSYDHCLPVDYILSRSIIYLGSRYAQLFRLHSERLNVLNYADDVALPETLQTVMHNFQDNLRTAYEIERVFFQRAVVSPGPQRNSLALYKVPSKVEKPLFALDYLELQKAEIHNLATEVAKQSRGLQDVEIQKHALIDEITAIKGSKSFKMTVFFSKAFRKIKPRS